MNFESLNSNEDSKLDKLKKAGKKAVFSTALAVGLSAGSGEVIAQNQDNLSRDKIENVGKSNPYEKMVKEVDSKKLKKLLKGYEPSKVGMPVSRAAVLFSDREFVVTDPVVGQTESAANMQALEIVKGSGSGNEAFQILSYHKKLSNGDFLVVNVVVKR
ncbi:MAG: hypothetical protein ACI88L_000584 [Candidatus Paceibacteria bacterium]|jgi:hypothetical protein